MGKKCPVPFQLHVNRLWLQVINSNGSNNAEVNRIKTLSQIIKHLIRISVDIGGLVCNDDRSKELTKNSPKWRVLSL